MKSYWDYSDIEQANMTQEAVAALLDVELMTKGILKPVAPVLTPIASVPVGGKQKFFGVHAKGRYGSDEHLGVCFASIEDAQKFIELNPLIRDYDYEVGSDFAYTKPVSDSAIMAEELYTQEQINSFRSELKRRKSASDENEKLTSEFNDASRKADEATKGVWSDWYSKCSKKSRLDGIVQTFSQYVKLAGNDEQIALGFLGKTFSFEDIAGAREWFPGIIPEHQRVMEATEEASPAKA